MKIVFGIQGYMPYKNGGGGAKVVDIIFKGFNFKNLKWGEVYFAWENGMAQVGGGDNKETDISDNKGALRKAVAFVFKKAISSRPIYYLFSVYKEKRFTNRILKFQSTCSDEKIVITSFINTGLYSYLKKVGKNKPDNVRTIISYHCKGPYAEDLGFEKTSFFYNYIDKRENLEILNADLITFPSKASMKMFIKKKGEQFFVNKKIEIVYNGIDCKNIDQIIQKTTSFQKEHSKNVRIINVANHVTQKRFDLLVDVAKVLKSENVAFQIVNIGYGDLLVKHQELIKKEGLDEYIKILGKVPSEQVIIEMSKSDIFFMPSENVVFDLVTLEAMYCGLPVVVSADGGNFEAIDNKVDGFLIEKGDVKAFASQLKTLINSAELRQQIGERARVKVLNQFTVEKMAEGYLNLCKTCF